MANVIVEKNSYKVESLYQWDKNQMLYIYGLSLASAPEIHFTNETMDGALVRSAAMDVNGVVSVMIPNSFLQKPYRITVYICQYSGQTFESMYKLVIPVKARQKPADYTIENDDGEIYSFNELKTLIYDIEQTTNEQTKRVNDTLDAYDSEIEDMKNIVEQGLEVATVGANAVNSDAIVAGAVTEPKLASNAVTTIKIKNLNVTTEKLAALCVITDKIANGAITTEKILNNAVTEEKLDIANFTKISKIASGSYVGTGTSGNSNKTRITYDFKPKIVIVQKKSGSSLMSLDDCLVMLNGVTAISTGDLTIAWNDAYMTFYSSNTTSGQFYQMNASDTTYYWVAIG